ncbi:MAG: hypothetical protein BEN19_01600 [Epulopiscium sp. Nuni2H_MBin003]|nr:MAG: hypothetical protein BEN19_01600 [Epulopiscium sp. Nuni2H_MBin003]
MSTVIIILLMAYTLIEPQVCITGATTGLLLWFNKVLPSLLPFIILTQLLFKLGLIFKLEKYLGKFSYRLFGVSGSSLVTFVLGSIGGSPTGAKLTKQLLGNISNTEAIKTLCFSNNTGPLFIIGTVGTILLKDVRLGYFLMIVHILSAFTILLLTRFYKTPSSQNVVRNTYSNQKFVEAFTESVQNSMETIVYVGGFIIFFSVIISILKSLSIFNVLIASVAEIFNVEAVLLEGVVLGSMEFSNGSALIAPYFGQYQNVLPILSLTLAFGGFCVFFQTAQILSSISLGVYFVSKVMQGVFAYLLTIILYPVYQTFILKVPTIIDLKGVVGYLVLFVSIAIFLYAYSSNKNFTLEKAPLNL